MHSQETSIAGILLSPQRHQLSAHQQRFKEPHCIFMILAPSVLVSPSLSPREVSWMAQAASCACPDFINWPQLSPLPSHVPLSLSLFLFPVSLSLPISLFSPHPLSLLSLSLSISCLSLFAYLSLLPTPSLSPLSLSLFLFLISLSSPHTLSLFSLSASISTCRAVYLHRNDAGQKISGSSKLVRALRSLLVFFPPSFDTEGRAIIIRSHCRR